MRRGAERLRAAVHELRRLALPWSEDQQQRDRLMHPRWPEFEERTREVANLRRRLAALGDTEDDQVRRRAWSGQLSVAQAVAAKLAPSVTARRTFAFTLAEQQGVHDALALVLDELDDFLAADGLVHRVEERHDWASRVRRASIDDHRQAWDATIAAAATDAR